MVLIIAKAEAIV